MSRVSEEGRVLEKQGEKGARTRDRQRREGKERRKERDKVSECSEQGRKEEK